MLDLFRGGRYPYARGGSFDLVGPCQLELGSCGFCPFDALGHGGGVSGVESDVVPSERVLDADLSTHQPGPDDQDVQANTLSGIVIPTFHTPASTIS